MRPGAVLKSYQFLERGEEGSDEGNKPAKRYSNGSYDRKKPTALSSEISITVVTLSPALC